VTAPEQKELGSQDWMAENFSKAIEHFTNAIDATSEKEMLKVLYSNRSACHLKLKQNALSLVDANKCIEIDDKWTKGYMRKGDALYADQKLTDAYNAYNAGLRHDGKDAVLIQKAEQVMNTIASQSSGTSSGRGWGSQQSSSSSSSWGSGSASTASATAPPLPGFLGKLQVYA
jgi:tetratricopeptide (TPR) repeat protein